MLGSLAWAVTAALTAFWPDADDLDGTETIAVLMAVLSVLLLGGAAWRSASGQRPGALDRPGPWLLALAVVFAAWEAMTAKLDLLPRPFFVAPQ